jgi:hypothetical protein
MPAGFHFILPNVAEDPQIIVPIPHDYAADRKWTLLMTVARLKAGVTIPAAQADMSALVRRMAETNRRYRTRDANVVPLAGEMAHDSRLAVLVLFGATGCVLLIGCVNVANLLLVRAAVRSKELAIRTALGAGRWRLTREVVAESVTLASIGGALGLVLAYWGTGVLVAAVPEHMFPRIEDVRVDLVVFAFGFGVALLVGLAAVFAIQTLRGNGPSTAQPAATVSSKATPTTSEPTPTTPSRTATTPPPTKSTPAPAPSGTTTTAPPRPQGPTAQQLARAITDYYALLPEDTKTGYSLLTDRFRRDKAGSLQDYQAFWNDFADVSATNATGTPPRTVQATITYRYNDGRVIVERTAYTLVDDDGVLKIDSSKVLGR